MRTSAHDAPFAGVPSTARGGCPVSVGNHRRSSTMSRSPLLRLPPLLLLVFSSPLFLLVEGQDKLPNLEMTGQPASCYGGGLNGEWVYQGRTADGKGYFGKDGGAYGFVYLHFDKNSDGGEESRCLYNNHWVIGPRIDPSRTQDLDGDGDCLHWAGLTSEDTSGAPTPPETGRWDVGCRDQYTTLSFTPICPQTNYAYTYPKSWTPVDDGCGTGVAKTMTQRESCPALPGCKCSNKQEPQTETQKQPACDCGKDYNGKCVDTKFYDCASKDPEVSFIENACIQFTKDFKCCPAPGAKFSTTTTTTTATSTTTTTSATETTFTGTATSITGTSVTSTTTTASSTTATATTTTATSLTTTTADAAKATVPSNQSPPGPSPPFPPSPPSPSNSNSNNSANGEEEGRGAVDPTLPGAPPLW